MINRSGIDLHFIRAVRSDVFQYCFQVSTRKEANWRAPRVRIVLRAAIDVADFRDSVVSAIEEIVRAQLPRAEVTVGVDLDPTLVFPCYRLRITPPAPGARPAGAPAQRLPGTMAEPGRGTALLRLEYGQAFSWCYRIGGTDGWIPVGRDIPPSLKQAAIQLPNYATFIPRGGLLDLRHRGDLVEFRRSPARRRECRVLVNGVYLPPGDTQPAGETGSIEYTSTATNSTVLAYHVSWECS